MTTQTSWETVRAKSGTPSTATMCANSLTNAIDLDVELPRTTAAPRAARRALCGAVDGRDDPDLHADAELRVSELVTNALLHGVGAIRLRAGSSHVWFELSVDGLANADQEPGDAA